MSPAPEPRPGVLRHYLASRPALTAATAVVTVVSAVVELAIPWLLQDGIDLVTGAPSRWTLDGIALAMLVAVSLALLGYALTLVGAAQVFGGGGLALRRHLYRGLHRAPIEALARMRSGRLAYRVTADVMALGDHLQALANGALFHGLLVLAALGLMATISARLTLVVLAVLLAVTWLGSRLGRRLPAYQRAVQVRSADLAGVLQESLDGAATLRALGAEAVAEQRLDAANAHLCRTEVGNGRVRGVILPLWHFGEALSTIIVLWYGGTLVLERHVTIGALVGFMAYQQLIADPLSRAGEYFYHWQASRALARRVGSTLAEDPSAAHPANAPIPDAAHPLVIERLTVLGEDGVIPRLDLVSLVIRPRERVALLGENGSGKSTLLATLCALQGLDGGDVALGPARLASCEPARWRGPFGFMPQDITIFRGSLADNLALAKPGASPAALSGALVAAGGAGLAARLRGADGHRGPEASPAALSGGERKMVGLARLLLRDPRIALLDEPTAHLDSPAQVRMLRALEAFAATRTVVIATHDPDVARLCDRVVILEAGAVVGDGPAATMLDHDPRCRDLLAAAPDAPAGDDADPHTPSLPFAGALAPAIHHGE